MSKTMKTIKAWALIDKIDFEIIKLPHEYQDKTLIYSYSIFENKKSAQIEKDKSIILKIVPVEIKLK